MSHGTQDTARPHQPFAYGTITLFGGAFQPSLAKPLHTTTRSYNPGRTTKIIIRLQSWWNARFGLVPVRSPLLRESRLISLPPGTEMFHFPGLALHGYVFTMQ